MKKLQFLSLAMAGLALASCTDKDDSAAVPETTAGGYLAIALNMPTTSGTVTRAANDVYDHGDAWEYGVKDAYLLILGGADEATAKVAGIYDISSASYGETEQTDNVTTRTKYVTKINSVSGNMYAYVLMNYGDAAVYTGGNLSLNGISLMDKTLTDVQAIQNIAAYTFKTGYIPMSNSPISSAKGETTDPATGTYTTLTKVDADKIASTAESAEAGDAAADIYVERAAVKVSLSNATTSAPFTLSGETTASSAPIYAQVVGYILDNTNYTYTPARETASFTDWASIKHPTLSNFRFVGSAQIDKAGYRSYWAKDKNYDTYNANDFYRYAFTTFNVNGTKAKYCPENTFDVANQVWKQTTRVVLKVAIGTSKTGSKVNSEAFWIVNPTDNDTKATIYTETTLKAAIQAAAYNAIKDNVTGTANDIAVSDYATNAGVVTPTVSFGGTIKAGKTEEEIQAAMDEAVSANFNNLTCFIDGTCYYQVRIKHFGDDLTPWNDGEGTAPSAGAIYPGTTEEAAAKYLGRYSVLRNNWYEMDVTGILRIGYSTVPSILGPGDPTPFTPTKPKATDDPNDPNNPYCPNNPTYDPSDNPTQPYLPNPTYPVDPYDTPGYTPGVDPRQPDAPGGTTDDEIDSYIKTRINILSWAVRKQNVVLQ